MGFRYLLDTNIVSDLVRHPAGRAVQRMAKAGESRVCTSIVVACELRFGAAKRGSARLARQLDRVLGLLEALPLDAPVEHRYAEIRLHLERAGTPIGPNDLLIAAQALALGLTLVTGNAREFMRVPGLAVENWLEP
ncbi:MAG TPA: type II toxin-antitoxin system VapC family toxin [Burkholderiales bacterium]|nr:type II toxin-antitoxin system VapC family toxin [Burkholderiales bacterium]